MFTVPLTYDQPSFVVMDGMSDIDRRSGKLHRNSRIERKTLNLLIFKYKVETHLNQSLRRIMPSELIRLIIEFTHLPLSESYQEKTKRNHLVKIKFNMWLEKNCDEHNIEEEKQLRYYSDRTILHDRNSCCSVL